MSQLTICIIIFVLSLILYATNVLPMGVTALLSLAALVITGCLDAATALGGFSNNNTIVIVCMFIIAAGLNRTKFVDTLSAGIIKISSGSFKAAWFGFIILSVLLTSVLATPVVAFGIVFPLCTTMCKSYNISPSKVMFPLVVICIGCCSILPVGSAIILSGNINGLLETFGFTGITVSPLDYTIGRLPLMIILILWAFFVAPKFAPDQPVVPITGDDAVATKSTKTPLKPFSETMGYVIFFAAVVLLILSGIVGIDAWKICLVCALLEVVCGVLTEREVIAAIPVPIACMYVGALAMANALTGTGAGTIVGNWLANIVGNTTNNYILGGLFFIVPFVLTQFMLNQGVMNIFVPICLLTCSSLGANPVGPYLLVISACLTAFLTPMATPAIPLCMGAGGYDLKSLFKQGWLISIVLIVVYIGYVMTVYPAF